MAALLLLVCTGEAWGTDTFSGGVLSIPTVTIGNATFSHMLVTVGSIISVSNSGTPNGSVDSYNPTNNELNIPSVTVGTKTYNNVVITVGTLESIGTVSGADVYTGTDLIIPSVQLLGGAVYNNVVITVQSIQSPGQGMPANVRDVYNPATKELTIAAVQVGGRVYTNAVITPGTILSINNSTAAAHGTITGVWVQGVSVAVSGGASGTTTTDASGNYSFTNLPSGQSFTFTPSLAGYSYSPSSQTVSVPPRSTTTVIVPAMASSSVYTSYSISGTISYAGNATGPVYVLLFNSNNNCGGGCSSNGGTLVRLSSGSSAYTIRGLQSGTYTVSAFMDTIGTGQPNVSADPSGSSATINITSSNVATGANVTIADPTVTTPVAPQIQAVEPGNGSAFMFYNAATDNNGNETATSYKIAWGTDTNGSNGGSRTFNAQGTNATIAYVPGLANGSVLYFKMLASDSAGNSTYSSIIGPLTIGALTGANTVSGTVTFSGTATGPMIVAIHPPNGNGGIYFTAVGSQASPPTSGASYSVSGIPSGNYQVAVIIDNGNTGAVSPGDFTYGINGGASTFAVSGATTEDIALPTANAAALVLTNYFIGGGGAGYGISPQAVSGTKQIANITLMSGPNVAVPFDMGYDANSGNNVNLANSSIAPIVGQGYGLLLTYTDGTSEILTGSVSAVLGPDNVAQNLTVSSVSGVATPTFSWSAPATLPAFAPFTYSLQNLGSHGIDVSSSVTSVDLASDTYNQTLQPGTYYWQVQVEDANGNTAQSQVSTPYVVPAP
jgi:uncharacterized protein (DUF2141 family)